LTEKRKVFSSDTIMPEHVFQRGVNSFPKLTRKQTDTLRMICQGETNEYIAYARGVDKTSVEQMVRTIKDNVGLDKEGSPRIRLVNMIWNHGKELML
jgi:DNA-binding NarL/FixJ family response regulator